MAVVYRHRKAGTSEVFYIGIGKSLRRPYRKDNRSILWKNIINKYGYEVDIIFNNISWKEAKEAEILLIKLYGRRDLGTGCLINHTDGGEGQLGFKHSEETKEKLRNHKHTTESKIKMSKAKLGVKFTKEQISKSAEARKKIILNIETGIFYMGLNEAALSINMSIFNLNARLIGRTKNNTSLIYV